MRNKKNRFLFKKNEQKKYKSTEKLGKDQTNQKRYFIHYRDMKFFKQHGMNVTKLHAVYQLKKSPWLAKCLKNKTQQPITANLT